MPSESANSLNLIHTDSPPNKAEIRHRLITSVALWRPTMSATWKRPGAISCWIYESIEPYTESLFGSERSGEPLYPIQKYCILWWVRSFFVKTVSQFGAIESARQETQCPSRFDPPFRSYRRSKWPDSRNKIYEKKIQNFRLVWWNQLPSQTS